MSAGCSVRCPQRILAFVIWISFVIPHSGFIICAMIRCGIGYDIHRFVEGRKLVLGGVEIPYSRGLEGPVGRRYEWRNEQDRDYGQFIPTREYRRDNYTCRDWVSTTYRDGRPVRRSGSACRYEDGNWYFQ